MCEHAWVTYNCFDLCENCGFQVDNAGRYAAIVPTYGHVYRRRYNVYSRPVRFAMMLDRAQLGREAHSKIMSRFHILHDNWRLCKMGKFGHVSRYMFNRKVTVSFFVAEHFKLKRQPMLKNQTSEERQVKEIEFLLTEFVYKPPVKEKSREESIWDMFDT